MRQRAVHRKNHSPLTCANVRCIAQNRRRAVSYVSTGLARLPRDTNPFASTAEERFHTLARGWLAYPVTPIHSQLPPKSGCRKMLRGGKPPKSGCRNTIATYIVAERRHFSVTRYAERSGCVPGFCASSHLACRRYATTYGGAADSTC